MPNEDVARVLEPLDWLIGVALAELARHPFPEVVLHLGPDDSGRRDGLHFASFLVAHRAERLLQLTELTASALDNLEHGSLQLSAVAARCLFETAAVSAYTHKRLEAAWLEVNGSRDAVLQLVNDPNGEPWRLLWRDRLGTRLEGSREEGWPEATNVMTRLKQFGEADTDFGMKVKTIYDWLCEVAHPNGESQAVFWRRGERDRRGRGRVGFDPAQSQSSVKFAIIDAVNVSQWVLIPYARDLWWIAAETASVSHFPQDEDTRTLGVPQPTGRNEPCCCGSGQKTKVCTHPEPGRLSAEWDAVKTGRGS